MKKQSQYYIIALVVLFLLNPTTIQMGAKTDANHDQSLSPESYNPKFDLFNIRDQMTLTPIFTPDNALSSHIGWINQANSTIDIQNQYIKFFDSYDDWETNPTPFVAALLNAKLRGVSIRVQLRDNESNEIEPFLLNKGISVKYMGSLISNTDDDDWLSNTHNKLMIIDESVILISSINFGSGFINSREAGIVVQNAQAANYFTSIFENDWVDGEVPVFRLTDPGIISEKIVTNSVDYPSHTNIPKTNFTGIYNITLFTNPDNADGVIFNFLKAAKKSIYVSMYTISRPDFNNTLINLKKANPSIDIQVLISSRRVGKYENIDTWSAVKSLVDNLIPVYNASVDTFIDQAGFYHNKYWIIDGEHTFVYSGNWSPRSVTPVETQYSSDEGNRDMGIVIHDATDIADFYKNVWDQDVLVADKWELPIGIKQTSFQTADVVYGSITLSANINGLNNPTVSYRWGNGDYHQVSLTNNTFSEEFDTTTFENGITTFEVRAEEVTQVFTDKVIINVVNLVENDNWRFLITELLPNPEGTDSVAEFIELTNSFPFDLLIEDWQIGDDSDLFSFKGGTKIKSYSSIILAKDKSGFESTFSITADYEFRFTLKNTDGDYVRLLDNHEEYMDVVAYGLDAPDGSEKLSIPDSGESILRINLHIDTDEAADFTFGEPDPKGEVPQISMGILETDETAAPIITPWIFLIISMLPIYLKKQK